METPAERKKKKKQRRGEGTLHVNSAPSANPATYSSVQHHTQWPHTMPTLFKDTEGVTLTQLSSPSIP
jgi:hypothetical protein